MHVESALQCTSSSDVSFTIVYRGKWRDVHPDDKDLKKYHDWLQAKDGVGVDLERDELL